MTYKTLTLSICTLLILSGCATFRSYNDETVSVVSNLATGKVDEALSQHEKNTGSEKDLLYFMEKGELQRLKKLYPETIATWTEADKMISQWENEEKINVSKVGAGLGSAVINDKLRRYDGEDYEKVMLSTRLALAYLATGKNEDALVEIKKTWERENLIKTEHEKELDQAENEARQKGFSTRSEDLKGYPIATLNSPEVTSLKNGYQNAFSHYLSGFLYESAGEISLAAASYRTAIELQPSLPLLKEGLANMDARLVALAAPPALVPQSVEAQSVVPVIEKKSKSKSKKNKKSKKIVKQAVATPPSVAIQKAPQTSPFISTPAESDVLFIVETGVAPSKKSITIPLPIPHAGIVPISFPVIESNSISANKASSISLANNPSIPLTTITSVENLARRSLKDNLPWIMVRAAIRAAVKGGAQAAAYRQNVLAGLVVNVVNVATEQADERIWALLPAEITVARVKVPEGMQTIKIQTSQGIKEVTVNISGKYAVVPIRVIGNSVYNLQP